MIIGNIFMLWVGGGIIYYAVTDALGKSTAYTLLAIPCIAIGGVIVWANLKSIFKD